MTCSQRDELNYIQFMQIQKYVQKIQNNRFVSRSSGFHYLPIPPLMSYMLLFTVYRWIDETSAYRLSFYCDKLFATMFSSTKSSRRLLLVIPITPILFT